MKFHVRIILAIVISVQVGQSYAQALLSPPKNGQVYVIAHRGAHNGIPENSLPAYEKAIALNCDFVEIDVRTTKDDQFVSIHNSTIDAYVQNQTGRVSEMTLAELKELDIGVKIGKKWTGTRIPTFEEVLNLCKDRIGIYLDLKDAAPSGLIALIEKYQMQDQIVWCVPGNRHKTIMEIKRECPKCIPMPDPGEEKNLEKVMFAYKPRVVASMMKYYSKSFGKSVHDQNALVFVDDSADELKELHSEWKQLIKWNVDGIQTDHPEELNHFLLNKENRK